MKQLFNKKSVRILSAAFAGVMAFSSMAMFAGCTTAHPEVTITIEFNSESYELDYTLYRNMYPATVQHFIELADNGYYDNVCVHNYDSSMMYTGAYTFNKNETENGYGGLEYKDYFSIVKEYKSFTQTVFDLSTGEGIYTLYGEFANNAFSVEENGLKHQFGSIGMYYDDISSCTQRVTVQYSGSNKKGIRNYSLNATTSQFYIFSGNSSSTRNPMYCVFGTLNDDEPLDNLKDAISEYISEQGEGYEFATARRVQINVNDVYAEKDRVNYSVPNEPIIIKSVKVNKY